MKKIKRIFSIITLVLFVLSTIEIPQITGASIGVASPTGARASSYSYNTALVSWGTVKGASGYAIYRATSSSGSYKSIASTTSNTYKNTGLTTGKTYYYKIKAYKLSGKTKTYGNYSSKVSAKPVPSPPTLVKAVTASSTSIKVSWGGVAGANGYKVYRATSSSGTYKAISSTTSGVASYTNTGLTTGKTYYYKIKAYRNVGGSKVYSGYSAIVNSKTGLSVPPSVKAASASYSSIKISWGSVSSASGYRVYRATSSSGTYSYVSATTATTKSYTNTGLTTGKIYYYKVRAYKTSGSSKIYSSYSSAVNAKPALSVPADVKTGSATNNSISISWSGVSGANGYTVYRATSKSGTYAAIATTASKNYSNTSLKSGTTYYYKIKAYRNVSSSKVYSGYSSVVSGKTTSVSNVGVSVTSVSLNKSSDTLTMGTGETLTADILPSDADNKSVSWKSSNGDVAIVDNQGKITPISAGTATITVTTEDGDKTDSCVITVKSKAIKGIDVSKWQGTIKWSSVKNAGIQFAMLRASYGSSSTDAMFETNYSAAKSSGIAVGAYHYSYATTAAKATTEVNYFISQLSGKQFEYPVCVDIEDSSQSGLDKDTLTDIVLVYLKKLSAAGYYPMIYANKTWFTSKLDDSKLGIYDHWLAQWASSISYTGDVGIWQYSSSGSVSGISGDVDMDYSYVDYEAKIKALRLNGF